MLDSERAITRCWMLDNQQACFVHLGKYGDIMIMLPAFKAVAEELGKPVVCLVSTDFASIFDGVSYVQPWPHQLHWWKGVGEARKRAERIGLRPIVVKWWDEPGAKAPFNPNGAKTISLKIHGRLVTVPASEWDSFQASQWRYAGFTMEQMMSWPLVFDRRDASRESLLRAKYFRSNKPKILVNLSSSGTSPFTGSAQAMALLHRPGWEIINLANIRATRIYDLLGLYDHAVGLVTSDTATLHLASASKIPYIALINNGGAGSIPRGNCVLSIRYGSFKNMLGQYAKVLSEWEKH